MPDNSYPTPSPNMQEFDKAPCYQVIVKEYHMPLSIFQFKDHTEVNSFIDRQRKAFARDPIIQYVEHLPYPAPQMEMPPRPQDLEPLAIVMPDSPEDAQKLKAYLDGDS